MITHQYSLTFAFALFAQLLAAQSFNDCAADFRTKYSRIQLDAATRKRDDKKMDSLYRSLEAAFDECIIGSELPGFNLKSIAGRSYSREDLIGKVVYINFWIAGCAPCWQEMPVLEKIDALYGDNKDFIFISILLDDEAELLKVVRQSKILKDIDFDIIANPAPFGNSELKKVFGFPTHLFVDRNGKIAKRLVGAFSDSHQQEIFLRSVIDEMLIR